MQMLWRRVGDNRSPNVSALTVPFVPVLVRLAGFRLIEAGLEQNQPFEGPYVFSLNNRSRCSDVQCILGLVHVLRLASKAGASLSGESTEHVVPLHIDRLISVNRGRSARCRRSCVSMCSQGL